MNEKAGYIGYQLRELNREKELGSLFTDPNNPDDFIAGYVRALNARTAFVESVTPYGGFDGYFGIRVPAILEVQYDNVYAERLELLMRLKGENPGELRLSDEEDALTSLFRLAMEGRRATTLWTATETYAGFPVSVNDLFLSIEPVDFMGRRCESMMFKLSDIEMMSFGSEEERMYELLDDHYHEIH